MAGRYSGCAGVLTLRSAPGKQMGCLGLLTVTAAVHCAGFDQQLLAAAQRQAAQTRGMPLETRRRRMVAWLQRRGHSWGTVSALLKQLAL